MVECLGAYLAQGFEGKDGQIKKTHWKTKRMSEVNHCWSKQFYRKRKKIEGRFYEIDERLDEKDELDEIQSKAIARSAEDIKSIENKIEQKKQAIDSIQQELGKKRERLDLIDVKLKDEKALDEEQEQKIKALQEEIKILSKKSNILPMLLSSTALIISLVALALNFISK